MDDAQLDMRLWLDAVYRIREALQAVNTGNQDILKPPIFKLCQHTEPELRPFVFCQPHAQQFFLAFGINAQREEYGFVNYAAAVTNLQPRYNQDKQWDTAYPEGGFATLSPVLSPHR